MNVVVFQLLTGQDVIAELISNDAGFVTVKRPLIVTPTGTEDGDIVLNFNRLSFIFEESDQFKMPVSALRLMPVPANPDLEASYVKNMTGIELPTPPVSRILHS